MVMLFSTTVLITKSDLNHHKYSIEKEEEEYSIEQSYIFFFFLKTWLVGL